MVCCKTKTDIKQEKQKLFHSKSEPIWMSKCLKLYWKIISLLLKKDKMKKECNKYQGFEKCLIKKSQTVARHIKENQNIFFKKQRIMEKCKNLKTLKTAQDSSSTEENHSKEIKRRHQKMQNSTYSRNDQTRQQF